MVYKDLLFKNLCHWYPYPLIHNPKTYPPSLISRLTNQLNITKANTIAHASHTKQNKTIHVILAIQHLYYPTNLVTTTFNNPSSTTTINTTITIRTFIQLLITRAVKNKSKIQDKYN